jgi:glycosyltransferase involved in cell wall biosynthesis
MRIGLNAVFLDERSFGIGEYIHNLIERLTHIDRDNEYLVYIAKDLRRSFGDTNANFIESPLSGMNPFQRIIKEQFYWNRRLIGDGIDIYHSPFFYMPSGLRQKTVLTVHDLRFTKFPDTYNKARYLFLKNAVPRSVKKADRILASSENTKKDLIDTLKADEKKIRVVYLGVSELFRKISEPGELEDKRRELGLPEKYILFAGEFVKHKNLKRVLGAFAVLKKKRKLPQRLVLAGAGGQRDSILRRAANLGVGDDVVIAGFMEREDLPYVYNMADVFMFPSLYEGFGLPILEAMACGTPVITSNIGSMPEVAGDASILVDPYDVSGIERALYSVLTDEDLKVRLTDKGLKRIKEFSWDKTARRTLDVYRELQKETDL